MSWRRGFFRVWLVFAAGWLVLAYFHVNPCRDLYKEAFVSLSDYERRVPLEITEDSARKMLIALPSRREGKSTESQLAIDVEQVMAEVTDLRQRNASERRFQWQLFAMTAASVPAAVLLLGVIVEWVVAGFRRRPRQP